jgi:hypothetical protein
LIERKKEQFERPVAAFIVFETQEGMERCLEELVTESNFFGSVKYNSSGKAFTLLDEKI